MILLPELKNRWKNGKSKILKGGLSAGGTMKFMSANIKLKKLDETSKKELNIKTVVEC